MDVMVGLVPAIHVLATGKEGVDARFKPGHDARKDRGRQNAIAIVDQP
jgi:hypothetical protein